MSIIFHLDSKLKVYQTSSVNLDCQKVAELVVRHSISEQAEKPTNLAEKNQLKKPRKFPKLDLAENFAPFWKNLWEKYLQSENSFYLIIGTNGGFTDSRIIFLWLKSLVFFYPEKSFFVHKVDELIDLETADLAQIDAILDLAVMENRQTPIYSSEPRIGKVK